MTSKTIEFAHLSPDSKMFRFYNSKETNFNFSKVSTHIKIFYNGETEPRKDFFAEHHIYEKNQAHGQTFEVIIPHGSKSAKLEITTSSIGHDANNVDVAIFR